jgi:hypothetical protein
MRYYFLASEKSSFQVGERLLHVHTFEPCLSVKPSKNPYFGGFVVDEKDERPLEELKLQLFVTGLLYEEGGASFVRVNPQHLKTSECEAELAKDPISPHFNEKLKMVCYE